MIRLQAGDNGAEIVFQPWMGREFRPQAAGVPIPEVSWNPLPPYEAPHRKLVHGYVCPVCKNVVQASFLTSTVIDPKPFEEIQTTIRDDKGNLRVIRTGVHPRFHSKYDSKIIQQGSVISAQVIRLHDHFTKDLGEEITPLCPFVAHFSFRPDLLVKQLLVNGDVNPQEYTIKPEQIGEIKEGLQKHSYAKDEYKFVADFAGEGPTLWLVKRIGGYGWSLTSVLQSIPGVKN